MLIFNQFKIFKGILIVITIFILIMNYNNLITLILIKYRFVRTSLTQGYKNGSQYLDNGIEKSLELDTFDEWTLFSYLNCVMLKVWNLKQSSRRGYKNQNYNRKVDSSYFTMLIL